MSDTDSATRTDTRNVIESEDGSENIEERSYRV